MKNILSYIPGTQFSGKEILDWAKYQVANETSHKEYGEIIMEKFSNIKPEKLYCIETNYRGTGCGEIKNKPRIWKVREVN